MKRLIRSGDIIIGVIVLSFIVAGADRFILNAAATGAAKQGLTTLCDPFTVQTGPMGLIGCVDHVTQLQVVCEPMTAATGTFGLVACIGGQD